MSNTSGSEFKVQNKQKKYISSLGFILSYKLKEMFKIFSLYIEK